jgi:ribonuclease HI
MYHQEKILPGAIHCYTDGASRGNPGPSAFAFIIETGGEVIHEESAFIGTATNNTAEYTAIIRALRWLTGRASGNVLVFSDSELVVRQLSGEYTVKKPHLVELYREVNNLCSNFNEVLFLSVPREDPWIRRADALCNMVLDSAYTRI